MTPGRKYTRVGLVLVLVASTAFADTGSSQPVPQCRLVIMESLDTHTMPDGRVTIPVKLEEHDYRLMVDTGGYINTVSEEVVKREGYNPQTSRSTVLRGMGTTLLTKYVRADNFTIGSSQGKDFIFFVHDFESLSYDGLLAPQVLRNYDVDFDFAKGKLNLISPDHCPGNVVYWTKTPAAVVPIETSEKAGHIRIPVNIDGKSIMAIVDTGAATSYITRRAARQFLGIFENNPNLRSRGTVSVNGMNTPVLNYPFRTLRFGDVTVNNPRIEIVADEVWGENDLLLGVGILRQLRLYIAYKEKKLYITPALAN
jgi:predicted aspartyl protease